MNNPEYVKIGETRYKINTDFKVALRCNSVSMDKNIGDNERGLAIIYLLFGDKGLEDRLNHNKLLQLAELYLNCGKKTINKSNEKPDMDFEQDYNLIKASFRSDYNIILDKEKMHYWDFIELLNGLSNSELGNCCILNRVRNLRNTNLNEIKDKNEKKKIQEAQKRYALKEEKHIRQFTDEERANMEAFRSQFRKE